MSLRIGQKSSRGVKFPESISSETISDFHYADSITDFNIRRGTNNGIIWTQKQYRVLANCLLIHSTRGRPRVRRDRMVGRI